MDASSALIATSQNAYTAALQRQVAATANTAASGVNMQKAKAAAEQFEAFFASQMMDSMTEGLQADEYFGGGHGEDMWRSMMNQEYGKEIAKTGKLGVADTVLKAMLQAQEQRSAAANPATAATATAGAATASTDASTSDTPAAASQKAIVMTPAMRRALKGMAQ